MFDPSVKFLDIPPFWAGSLAISFIVGAYATETFRGAFLGIDRGQIEAARALGLSPGQMFFHMQLPQMWRLALPGLGNHMNSIIKDTALLSVIGVEEITYTADMATSMTGKPFTMYSRGGDHLPRLVSIIAQGRRHAWGLCQSPPRGVGMSFDSHSRSRQPSPDRGAESACPCSCCSCLSSLGTALGVGLVLMRISPARVVVVAIVYLHLRLPWHADARSAVHHLPWAGAIRGYPQ